MERPLGYHSSVIEILTSSREPDERQCQADSLTGAVASERVTETPKVPSEWMETIRREQSQKGA